MKCLKTKINYSKENKKRDWSIVAFINESRFYLHISGISIRTLKEENNIDKKKLYKCMYWSILKRRSHQFRNFKGNIDSEKYSSILENSVNKIKEILQKMEIAMK